MLTEFTIILDTVFYDPPASGYIYNDYLRIVMNYEFSYYFILTILKKIYAFRRT